MEDDGVAVFISLVRSSLLDVAFEEDVVLDVVMVYVAPPFFFSFFTFFLFLAVTHSVLFSAPPPQYLCVYSAPLFSSFSESYHVSSYGPCIYLPKTTSLLFFVAIPSARDS